MITINANVNLSDFAGNLEAFVSALIDLDKRLTEAGIATSVSIPQRIQRQASANGGQSENGPFATYYLAWRAKQGTPILSVFSKSGMSIEDSAKFYLQKNGFLPEQLEAIASGAMTIDGFNPDAANGSGSSSGTINPDDIL